MRKTCQVPSAMAPVSRPPWFVPTAHAASSCFVIPLVSDMRRRLATVASSLAAAPTAMSMSFTASEPLLDRARPVSWSVTVTPLQAGKLPTMVRTWPTEPGLSRLNVFVALQYGISPAAHAEMDVSEPIALLSAWKFPLKSLATGTVPLTRVVRDGIGGLLLGRHRERYEVA